MTKGTIPLDDLTKLQVCWIMLVHGSEAQKKAAADYLKEKGFVTETQHAD